MIRPTFTAAATSKPKRLRDEISLRDQFALQALQWVMLKNHRRPEEPGDGRHGISGWAETSYKIADAMLVAREKGGNK